MCPRPLQRLTSAEDARGGSSDVELPANKQLAPWHPRCYPPRWMLSQECPGPKEEPMTNTTLIGTAVGALALGSLVTAQFKTSSADASRSATALESRAGGAEVASAGPVLVNCGEGRRALVRQASYGGQRAAPVECVDAAALPMAVDAWGQPLVGRGLATPVLANYTTPVYSAPA